MIRIIYVIVFLSLCWSVGWAQTILFQDDFEDGNAYDWDYEPGWQVILDDTNYVFEGQGHNWAKPRVNSTKNATFKARIKLVQGSFHLKIKLGSGYYLFPIHPTFIQFFVDTTYIEGLDYQVEEGVWHSIKVTINENTMKFFFDDSLLFSYEDTFRPVLFGKLIFECNDHIYIDDVVVIGDKNDNQQKAEWFRTGGPLGGIGYDVRIDPTDPDIIYVTDNWAGCHKSYDGGETWHPKNEGIASRTGPTGDAIPIFSLTIDCNDPNIVWCGTFAMRGVYKSTDKAEHWELKANGIPNTDRLTFRSFAVEPGNSDIVYCGAEWGLREDEIPEGQSGASRGKIYKTTDGGENWTEILDSDALVRTIIIDPTDPNIIYAATGIFDRDDVKEEGIWKSTDAGSTWFHINNGITNLTIGDIEMHPNNPQILLAAAGRLAGFGGGPDAERGEILRTINGGETWTRSYGGYDGKPFTYVEFDETDPNIVYAAASDRGFYKSVDGGITFFETTYNPPYINPGHIISIATYKSKPNWLISNSYGGGVFISEDGALSWHDASKGYTGCEITDIDIAHDNPLIIFAVARSSVFMSNDGGNNWHGAGAMSHLFNNVPSGPLEMRSVAINPKNSQIIVATDMERRLFKTTDGGKNWRTVFYLPSEELATVEFAPSNAKILYAGAIVRGGYSIDRPFPFVPTRPSHGMLKSIDGGENWSYINNGLEDTYKDINCIAVHPTNPDTVYIGTLNSGIYKTVNGGNSWFKISEGIMVPDIRSIAIDPTNTNTIYAGAQRGGFYKSTNAGQSWHISIYGMDAEAAIRSIAIDPTNPRTIYAGDWLSGVYRSVDGGETWEHINKGLRTRAVQRLAISQDGKYLYAGTQGEGVFRIVFEQQRPIIRSVTPDTLTPARIEQGGSQSFQVNAFDPNNDTLSYSWKLDGATITSAKKSNFKLNSSDLSTGEHTLSVEISDGESEISVRWAVSLVPNMPPEVAVISPNGGEIFPADEIKKIKWQATDNIEVTHIDIEYSIDNGENWLAIKDSLENSGEYDWVVPYTPSVNCLIKVVAYDGANNQSHDISDAVFRIPSLIVSDLYPTHYRTGYLNAGDRYFVDEGYTITSIPEELTGLLWILTDNDDKKTTADTSISFTINEDAIIYIGYDRTMPTLPTWLSTWEKTELKIYVPDGIGWFEVYRKNFQQGKICLGGNYGTDANDMYIVLLQSKTETFIKQKKPKMIPVAYLLSQNYPNPFNPVTIIKYQLPKPSHVMLKIFNATGQEVATLVNKEQNAGFYTVPWDASGQASGMYFIQMKAGRFSKILKALLLK